MRLPELVPPEDASARHPVDSGQCVPNEDVPDFSSVFLEISCRNPNIIMKSVSSILVPLLLVALGGVPDLFAQSVRLQPVEGITQPSFNQKFVCGINSGLDYEDVDAVFNYVFESLPEEVYVYPTENYYYFQFYAGGTNFWGNIRLGIEDRDQGIAHFVYWEYLDDPQGPDDGKVWRKDLSHETGVEVDKTGKFRYSITSGQKTVNFQLNLLEQDPPKLFNIPQDEEFVFRMYDESGFQFFLMHKETHNHFMFVLNEEDGFPGRHDTLAPDIIRDRLSGFVFYIDSAADNRKILIAIRAQNARRNNYWDGPFDQLADNYIDDRFAELVQHTYPYTKDRINSHGIFTDVKMSRIAISPYYEYFSREKLMETIESCRKQPADELLPCLTYDYKTSW